MSERQIKSINSAPSDWRPIPDPTVLTNELVERAASNLREIIEARFDGLDKKIMTVESTVTRHTDIAIVNLAEATNIKHDAGQKLQDEKIRALTEAVLVFKASVSERFQISEVQTEKTARDVKSAVDAAFAAAKEAVGEQNRSNASSITKSETSTTKQIDQLTENLRLSVKTTDDKIGDLKDRIIAMESKSSIADPATTAALRDLSATLSLLKSSNDQYAGGKVQVVDDRGARRDSNMQMIATISAVITGIAVALSILPHLIK